MRAIFGGKSLGNQAIAGVRKLTEEVEVKYHKATKVMKEDIYVDNILPEAQETKNDCQELTRDLEAALAIGGMSVNGFRFSGSDPNPELETDGSLVGVAGMRWNSKDDQIQIDMSKKLNFSKKIRGEKV